MDKRFIGLALAMAVATFLFAWAWTVARDPTLKGGCAKPPLDEVTALKRRGVDTTALDQELRVQEAKLALFRSYRRTEEIIAALGWGEASPPRAILSCASKCVEDGNVVCYCVTQGISCVERSK